MAAGKDEEEAAGGPENPTARAAGAAGGARGPGATPPGESGGDANAGGGGESRGPGSTPGGGAARAPHHRARLLALGVAVAMLFPALAKSGIWDPYELDAADLARRVAARVLGAHGLELPNAVNGLPTLTDLRMGELPFTSMAVGFRLFGLHDWSGRLPLAVWGLAGAAVLFELLARLIDRRAGVYAVIALVTMPLYFMQARTMLGDVVTMSALTMAFSGLTGALLDGPAERGRGGLAAPQIAWLGVAAVGLLSGFLARGLLIGVAVPSLAVGAAWLVLRGGDAGREPGGDEAQDEGAERAEPDALGARDLVGAAALVIGLVALGFGLRALLRASPDAPLSRLVGFPLLKKPPTDSTFDLVVRQLGHALFPWSAFLPFAFGRLLRAPAPGDAAARDREIGLRTALLMGVTAAYLAHALLAPRAGALAFAAPALLAAVAALAILDLERGAPASRALSLGMVVLGAVLLGDILREPEKALAAFVVDKPQFPKSFEHDSARRLVVVFGLFAGLSALTWFEEQPRAWFQGASSWLGERAGEYRALLGEIARVWAGNLVFGVVVIEAALVGLGGMIFVGRRVGWQPVDRLPKNFADVGVNLWWIVPLALLAAVPLAWATRDAFRRLVDVAGWPRARLAVVAALLSGAAHGLWYYPALAAQVSPKEAFESYARLARAGEPLALCSVRSRAAAYYAGGEVESFTDPARAFAWLTERREQRRWVLLKADDLPRLNHLYRGFAGKNLPVLDGRSSQILLASNALGDRPNENWLSRLVLDEAPAPTVPIDVAFEDQLEAFGWEVADGAGKVVHHVVPATGYHLRTYFRVKKQITGTWKAFVHIDGFQRRFNGDHNVLDGKYAMNLWRPGDVVVDDLPFQLEPNFTPGDYTVYFGFFAGETRFKVTRGQHHENRAIAGAIHVR